MEELNKTMLEYGYKPILVFKFGVSNASPEQMDKLMERKNKEFDFLKKKYDIIFLTDPKSILYQESVEILDPFFRSYCSSDDCEMP